MFLAMEVVNGNLNGSCKDVERKETFDNVSFCKKINGRSKISSQCIKYGLNEYMEKYLGEHTIDKTKDGKQIKYDINPFKYIQQDIFGYMLAVGELKITKKEFEELDKEEQRLWIKDDKSTKYKRNMSKKRVARLQCNAFVNVSNNRIEKEYCIASSNGDNIPYVVEMYSGVHTNIANLDIENIGKYVISDKEREFRDYDVNESEALGIRDLTKDEKLDRIDKILESIEYLSISSRRTNSLTDTKPKFVIMADYSWGNNAFGNAILNKDGLNINALRDAIRQNEKFRLSNIYIGVNEFSDTKYNTIKEELKVLEEEFGDVLKVTNVTNAFKEYKKELRDNL